MANFKVRHIIQKKHKTQDDTFLWFPPPSTRKSGWKGISLKANNKHSNQSTAIAQAEWLNTILDYWRIGEFSKAEQVLNMWADGQPYEKLSIAPFIAVEIPLLNLKNDPAKQTLRNLIGSFYNSSNFKKLKPNTRSDYSHHLNSIPESMLYSKNARTDVNVLAIKRSVVKAYYEHLYEAISPNTARARLTVLKLLFSYAIELDWIKENPVKAISMQTSKPRVVVWTGQEIAAFVKHADAMELDSIADIVIIACHTAQRQADILQMSERHYQHGCILVTQNKTDAIVNVPLTPISEQRVQNAMIRNENNRSQYSVVNSDRPLFVSEKTLGHRGGYGIWKQKSFNTWFNNIKAEVVKECPDFENKRFQDLRDTAVTLMARANANQFEIATITGHTFTSITQILKHYLALDQGMANSAIKKMVKHLEGKLIK